MGQEVDEHNLLDKKESEDYHKVRIIIMLKKSKRILSLVLAFIMICSTLGVMAFAQERAVVLECYWCKDSERFAYSHAGEQFNRIVECPTHGGHDAEEWYVGQYYRCLDCGGLVFTRTSTKYICLD